MTTPPPYPPPSSYPHPPSYQPPGHQGQPPKKGSRGRTMLIVVGTVVALLVLVGLIGNAGKDDKPTVAASSSSVAPERPSVVASPPAERATSATASSPAAPAQSSSVGRPATATTPLTNSAVAAAVMPAVICMNLQAAQDLIQQAGVFFSRSADATGRERHQVIDSNWVVVAQKPEPGAPVTEAEAVLSVVKIGEPGDCS